MLIVAVAPSLFNAQAFGERQTFLGIDKIHPYGIGNRLILFPLRAYYAVHGGEVALAVQLLNRYGPILGCGVEYGQAFAVLQLEPSCYFILAVNRECIIIFPFKIIYAAIGKYFVYSGDSSAYGRRNVYLRRSVHGIHHRGFIFFFRHIERYLELKFVVRVRAAAFNGFGNHYVAVLAHFVIIIYIPRFACIWFCIYRFNVRRGQSVSFRYNRIYLFYGDPCILRQIFNGIASQVYAFYTVPFSGDGKFALYPILYGVEIIPAFYLIIFEVELILLGFVKAIDPLYYDQIHIARRIGIRRFDFAAVVGHSRHGHKRNKHYQRKQYAHKLSVLFHRFFPFRFSVLG